MALLSCAFFIFENIIAEERSDGARRSESERTKDSRDTTCKGEFHSP